MPHDKRPDSEAHGKPPCSCQPGPERSVCHDCGRPLYCERHGSNYVDRVCGAPGYPCKAKVVDIMAALEKSLECGLFAIYVPGHCVLRKGHRPAADHLSQYGDPFTRGLTKEEGGHE